MKKISLSLIVLTIILSVAPSAMAIDPLGIKIKNSVKAEIESEAQGKNIKNAVKNKLQEEGLLSKVKNFLKKNLKFEARVKGEITIIGADSFTLESEDGTFEINVTDKTQLLIKFGGKSKLSDYSVGDEVMVFGKFTDETKLTIDAKVIKNNSIQKRRGAFFGTVTEKNNDNFVIDTIVRGFQTVYFGEAKFVQRNEKAITYEDVNVDDKVRVKGIWNKTSSVINEVIQVKDFSIPNIVPTETPED